MSRISRFLRRLRRNQSGLALIEFAYATPVWLIMGVYGIETANFALTHLRISQMTANLADTASRIGEESALALVQIRESDINDAFQAVRLQGGGLQVTQRGRVILSSLQVNATGGQWIKWQRCVGMRNGADYAARYGVQNAGSTGTGAPTDTFKGMGKPGEQIQAPAGTAVMYAEISYEYEPLLSGALISQPIIHAEAAFLVRDRRDLANANNPANPAPAATPSTCNLFTA